LHAFLYLTSPVAFDTLKLAQRLEAAGFPPRQAQDMASAISDTIGDTLVTREYLDLRLAELRADIARDLAATQGVLRAVEVPGGP
jgi:hypothetical protein